MEEGRKLSDQNNTHMSIVKYDKYEFQGIWIWFICVAWYVSVVVVTCM